MSHDNLEDIQAALGQFGDKASIILSMTLKDADKFMADIESALACGRMEDAGLAAHSLKSIMKQIHADSVAGAAYALEQAGKAGDAQVCQSSYADLKTAYDAIRDDLSSLYAL